MADENGLGVAAVRHFLPFETLAETQLNDIRRKLVVNRHPKGRILFKRDEDDRFLHFLVSGSVDLADSTFAITPLDATSERARQAIDQADPHAFTAITTSDVVVASLPRDYLDLVLTWAQAGNYMVTDLSAGDVAGVEADWMSSLLQSPLIAQIPPAHIQKLFQRFHQREYRRGDVVFEQGSAGDFFYVVKSGRAVINRRMTVGGEAKDVTLAELRPGDVFGEDALIGDAPRNASVVMATDGVLMCLARDDFATLLEKPLLQFVEYASLKESIDAATHKVAIIDVRLPREFQQGHVPGAQNIPLHVLRQHLERLDQDTVYVTTCDGGRRGSLAAYILGQNGFEALVLKDPPEAVQSDTAAT
jgi:CRP-like cAMP-binding protein